MSYRADWSVLVGAVLLMTVLGGCGTPIIVRNATSQGTPVTAEVFDHQGAITASVDLGYVSSGETRSSRAKLPRNGHLKVAYTTMGGLMFAPHGHFSVSKLSVQKSWTDVPVRLEVVLGGE